MSGISFAQSDRIKDKHINKNIDYLPNVGDTILFFPINPDYAGMYSTDYPCFYDAKCLDTGIKAKYRFAADNQKLTPKSEIENYYFRVNKLGTVDFNKKNKLAFSAVLERVNDHIQIILAFPADMSKEPKESILNSWLVKNESLLQSRTARANVVIPFLEKWFIDRINSLEGKTLLFKRYYLRNIEDYFMVKFVSGETKANNLSSTDGVPIGAEFIVNKMRFVSWDNQMVYSQPYLSLTNSSNAYLYRIPVTHYAGNSDKLYVIKGEIENLVQRHFVVKDDFLSDYRLNGTNLDSLIGREYYFNGGYWYNKEKDKYTTETRYISKDEPYNLKVGFYKCVGYDYFLPYHAEDLYYSQYVILEDSIGQHFRFPVEIIHKSYPSSDRYKFTEIFEKKEIFDARIKKEADKAQKKKMYIAKYGNIVGVAIADGKCTEQRFKELCKKYGKNKAEYMARGWFRVGWTFREVKEAIGKEYFECVYTHEDKYAYWAVYKHSEYTPSYVTFRNDVVISIDDYMNTDF